VESPWKGLSDMDAARAAMGQGWPFAACPWSGDGAREPRRSRAGAPSSDAGVCFFAYFLCTSKSYEAQRSNSRRLARRVSAANQVSRP
jgi:hypothetical protein